MKWIRALSLLLAALSTGVGCRTSSVGTEAGGSGRAWAGGEGSRPLVPGLERFEPGWTVTLPGERF